MDPPPTVTITDAQPPAYRNGTGPPRDWTAVRARYVEGVAHPDGDARTWPALSEVAAHYAIGVDGCKERSRQEGWVEQRQAFQGRLAHDTSCTGLA